ncbi:unnamed protein product [Urochloa humidicola]
MRTLLEEAQTEAAAPCRNAGCRCGGEHCPVTVGDGKCSNDDLEMLIVGWSWWSKVRSDMWHLVSVRPAVAEEVEEHLAAIFHQASLEAIDRAMHRDIYLAAVYVSKRRRCSERLYPRA